MPKRRSEHNNDAKVVRAAPAPSNESEEEEFQPLKARRKTRKQGVDTSAVEYEYVVYNPDSDDDSGKKAGLMKQKKSSATIECSNEESSSGSDDDESMPDDIYGHDEDDDVYSEYEEEMQEQPEQDLAGFKEAKPASSAKYLTKIEEHQNFDTFNRNPPTNRPNFPELSANKLKVDKSQYREIRIPQHRYGILKDRWMDIYNPIVKHLGLQIRFNVAAKRVEIRTCEATNDIGAIQKAEDFIKAFTWGFEIQDALAILRLDDLYLERFKITDVKTLKGDNLSRCIGRIVGCKGKTKFTIENVTKTRIVVNHDNISLLGTYHNLATARRAICSLIMGKSPGKVYSTMRAVAAKSFSRL